MHTTYSDGAHTIAEMAEAAARLGRKYIAITDHVGHLKIAGAMDVKTIEKQWREIEKVDKAMSARRKYPNSQRLRSGYQSRRNDCARRQISREI